MFSVSDWDVAPPTDKSSKNSLLSVEQAGRGVLRLRSLRSVCLKETYALSEEHSGDHTASNKQTEKTDDSK